MKKRTYQPGTRFGMLTLVRRAPMVGTSQMFVCVCDCGVEKTLYAASVASGRTQSCGCFAKATLKTRCVTHGQTRTPMYRLWGDMVNRCTNPSNRNFKHYDRWRKFENFIADVGERPSGKTLDRIDNDKGYSPDNFRWATRAQQARNRRTNVKVTIGGKTQTLAEWIELLHVRPVIVKRLAEVLP